MEVVNCTGRSFTVKPGMTIALVEALTPREVNLVDSVNRKADHPETSLKEKGVSPEKDKANKTPCPDVDLTHLDPEDRDKLQALLEEYSDIFAQDELDLGEGPEFNINIDTGDSTPIQQRMYRTPLSQREELERQLETMLEAG